MLEENAELSEWMKLSQDWEQSGLDQKKYCARKGIRLSTFSRSRTKLILEGLIKPRHKHSKLAINREDMHFVPVNLPIENSSLQRANSSIEAHHFIEIQLPHGIVMRIPT